MAITVTSINAKSKRLAPGWSNTTAFCVQAQSADWSGCEVIKAAPTTGFLVIDSIWVWSTAKDITFTVGSGETGGNLDATIWGPLTFSVETTAAGYAPGVQYSWLPGRQIWLPEKTLLAADASGAGDVLVMIEGLILS